MTIPVGLDALGKSDAQFAIISDSDGSGAAKEPRSLARDHRDASALLREMAHINDAHLIEGLGAKGVKHLVIGIPSDMQAAVSDFQAGRIAESDFRQALAGRRGEYSSLHDPAGQATMDDAIIRTLKTAQEKHIQVHCGGMDRETHTRLDALKCASLRSDHESISRENRHRSPSSSP